MPTLLDIVHSRLYSKTIRGSYTMALEQLTIHGVEGYSGLNEQSVVGYFRAKNSVVPLLKDAVITPFETALKEATGYKDGDLQFGPAETKFDLGPVAITVKSAGRVKRPQLAEVYDGLAGFLDFVHESYREGHRRRGVRTIDGSPHIQLDDVMDKVEELQQEVTTREVTHSIKYADSRNGGYDGPVAVPMKHGEKLTEGNAIRYVHAKELVKKVTRETVKKFEDALKAETGYDNEHVPEDTEVTWTQIGSHLLRVQTVPEETVKYAGIINNLTKPAPAKPNGRSVVGDYVRIRDDLTLPHDVAVLYEPKERGGVKLVSLVGARTRMKQLKKQFTNKSVNQRIKHYPTV